MKRSLGALKLESQGGYFRSGDVTYTLYEDGTIQFSGDVSFQVPSLNYEVDIPFQNSIKVEPSYLKSKYYRSPEAAGGVLHVRRLNIVVNSVDPVNQTASATALIDKATKPVDELYGAGSLRAVIDTSGELVKIVSLSVVDGWTYFDKHSRTTDPEQVMSRRYYYGNNDIEYFGDIQLTARANR